MCLVETDKAPKPIAACATPIMDDLEISTNSPLVQKARESVLEALLLNHPLDCPICDQGGECDLQDQYALYGADIGRNWGNKRSVEDKDFGPLLKTVMSRCIHCTRCVRFSAEICGMPVLGTLSRGVNTEIGLYVGSRKWFSELSGNLIDLCPVGAIGPKISAFKVRPWELLVVESVDLTDACGSALYIHLNEFGVCRVLPKKNKQLNENWISDKARFSFDALNNNLSQKFLLSTRPLKTQDKVVLIVTKEFSLENIALSKHISYIMPNILLLQDSIFSKAPNIFFFKNNPQFAALDDQRPSICILFSTNLKAENLVLHTKLRFLQSMHGLAVYAAGLTCSTTFALNYLNLNVAEFLVVFKQKHAEVSCSALTENCAFIIGKALRARIFDLYFFLHALKLKILQIFCFFVHTACNDVGLDTQCLHSLSSADVNKARLVYALEANDSVQLRRLQNKFPAQQFMLLTAYFTAICNWWYHRLPLASFYESSGIFISTEQRVHKFVRLPLNSSSCDTRHTLSSLVPEEAFFEGTLNKNNFFLEKVYGSPCFDELPFKSGTLLFDKSLTFKFSNYPLKSCIEDYTRTSSFVKNSSAMAECSRYLRQNDFVFNLSSF